MMTQFPYSSFPKLPTELSVPFVLTDTDLCGRELFVLTTVFVVRII